MSAEPPMSPAKRFIAVRVFPCGMILFSLLFVWIGIDQMRLAMASTEWPAVRGVVIQSGVESESSRGGSGSTTSVSYHAKVVYRYRVDDGAYQGERISYGAYGTEDAERAARIAARYPEGLEVRVHVRPEDPGESVLEPGTEGVPWFYLAMGSVFALVGALMFVFLPRLFPPPAGTPSKGGGLAG